MAFLRLGYPVRFEPISVGKRTGKSHIRPIHDGVKFLAIIFKIATLYSPLKIFLPISGLFFATGLGYYLYTYFTIGRFTNMSMLILSYLPDWSDLRADHRADLQQVLINWPTPY